MQPSRYGSVLPPLAALMLLSDMPAHGIPSTEDCTAVGECAWQMMVHLQSVLSQFFQSAQHCNAGLDRAPVLHGGKGCCAFGGGRLHDGLRQSYAPLFGLFDCSLRKGGSLIGGMQTGIWAFPSIFVSLSARDAATRLM